MQPHRFAPLSLVFGLVFTAIGLTFLAGDIDVWRMDWSWVWPIVLTIAGLAILLSARSAAADNTAADPGDELPPASDPSDPPAT